MKDLSFIGRIVVHNDDFVREIGLLYEQRFQVIRSSFARLYVATMIEASGGVRFPMLFRCWNQSTTHRGPRCIHPRPFTSQKAQPYSCPIIRERKRAVPQYTLRRVEEEVAKLYAHVPDAIRLKETELHAEERRLASFLDFIGEGRGSRSVAQALEDTERKVSSLRDEPSRIAPQSGQSIPSATGGVARGTPRSIQRDSRAKPRPLRTDPQEPAGTSTP